MKALGAHGPCPEHRRSFVNVSSVACGDTGPQALCDGLADDPGGSPGQESAWSNAGPEN
jgi:hypothetical protein